MAEPKPTKPKPPKPAKKRRHKKPTTKTTALAKKKQLSPQHELFVAAYLTTFNATKAAKAAGYSEKSACVQGARLLKNVNVRNAVLTRMNTEGITPDRIKTALAEIAFGADLGDVWDDIVAGKTLREIKASGVDTRLIKSISETPGPHGTSRRVEVQDRLKALEKLAHILKMLGGTAESEPEPPTVNIEIEAQVVTLLTQSTKIHPFLDALPALPAEDIIDVEAVEVVEDSSKQAGHGSVSGEIVAPDASSEAENTGKGPK